MELLCTKVKFCRQWFGRGHGLSQSCTQCQDLTGCQGPNGQVDHGGSEEAGVLCRHHQVRHAARSFLYSVRRVIDFVLLAKYSISMITSMMDAAAALCGDPPNRRETGKLARATALANQGHRVHVYLAIWAELRLCTKRGWCACSVGSINVDQE